MGDMGAWEGSRGERGRSNDAKDTCTKTLWTAKYATIRKIHLCGCIVVTRCRVAGYSVHGVPIAVSGVGRSGLDPDKTACKTVRLAEKAKPSDSPRKAHEPIHTDTERQHVNNMASDDAHNPRTTLNA